MSYQPQASRFGPRQTEEQKAAIRADFAKLNLDANSQRALEILAASDRIDYGLVAALVKHIVSTADTTAGAILVFMPGVMEIKQCVQELQSAHLGSVEILPLHANLSSAEQKRVFLSTAPRRKIVVATNVAETSVTIPDVVYVVDGGRVKETQFDAETGMQRLVECWTSRASGRQRRGRAGRTQPGQVSCSTVIWDRVDHPVLQAVHEENREQFYASIPHSRDLANAARGLVFTSQSYERDD